MQIRSARNRRDDRVAGSFSDTHDVSTSKLSRAGLLAHAKRGYERYTALATASTRAGDAIETENYYQYAEHYYRLMREQANLVPGPASPAFPES